MLPFVPRPHGRRGRCPRPAQASGRSMEAVFAEFDTLYAEALVQAEAVTKAASAPKPPPVPKPPPRPTRAFEYDGGVSQDAADALLGSGAAVQGRQGG